MKVLLSAILVLLLISFASLNTQAGISFQQDTNEFENVDDFDSFDESSDEFESDDVDDFEDNDIDDFGDDDIDDFGDDDFDDFDDAGSEFEEAEEDEEMPTDISEVDAETPDYILDNVLHWSLYALALTIVAGFLVRSRQTRSLRGLILLGSLFVFGFYKGGCPCMISSFQDTILIIMGSDVHWQYLVWFIGLIPITYILGQVWCGWVCHLGALQEFLFLPARYQIFKGEKSMKIMKVIRYALLITLIVQLGIRGSIYWCSIDPFKAVFNVYIDDQYFNITVILLALLLLTSLFSYRPFCRSACPVGLTLGFISKIPGASIVGLKGKCIGCKSCNESCNYDAILRTGKTSVLNNADCIACGDCMDACGQGGLRFKRKNKIDKDILVLNNECEIK